MKKIALLLFVAFTMALPAQTVYVSSLKATLYSNPTKGAATVSKLKRGTSLEVVESQDKWLKVQSENGNGWIQALFTSSKKPGGKISLSGNPGKNARIKARKRASSDVTAASARGLMADSGRNRSNATASFDPQDISDMESYSVSEDELLIFLSEGEIQ